GPPAPSASRIEDIMCSLRPSGGWLVLLLDLGPELVGARTTLVVDEGGDTERHHAVVVASVLRGRAGLHLSIDEGAKLGGDAGGEVGEEAGGAVGGDGAESRRAVALPHRRPVRVGGLLRRRAP